MAFHIVFLDASVSAPIRRSARRSKMRGIARRAEDPRCVPQLNSALNITCRCAPQCLRKRLTLAHAWQVESPDRDGRKPAPAPPIKSWGRSSAGRAPRSQCGGRGFDPPRLHHFKILRPPRNSCSPPKAGFFTGFPSFSGLRDPEVVRHRVSHQNRHRQPVDAPGLAAAKADRTVVPDPARRARQRPLRPIARRVWQRIVRWPSRDATTLRVGRLPAASR